MSYKIGEVIRDHLGQEFCYVPAGLFLGGLVGKDRISLPAAYLIGRHPVTAGMFQAFLRATKHPYGPEDLTQLQQMSPMPDCPACNVSWDDAKAFCRWLRAKTGEYYALPQVDEWEKAARGEDGRLYPWGNSAPEHDLAYFDHADAGTTSQIGRRPGGASIYGCHDLAGNVWEWTLDSFNDERDLHVLKGGSWQNPATHLENGARLFSYPPAKRRTYMGFRVVYLPADLYANYMAAYEQR